jgi:sugar (pentulose or hexulose) kinase
VAFRFAAIADLLPGVREVVATGGALLRDPEWIQIMADALARPVHVSAVEEASLRGAAVSVLRQMGHEPVDGGIAGVFQPREQRAEPYRSAREAQQRLYEVLRGQQ